MSSNAIQLRPRLEYILAPLVRTVIAAQQQVTSSMEQAQSISRACTRQYKHHLSPFAVIFADQLEKLSQGSKDLDATGVKLVCFVNQLEELLNDSVKASGRSASRPPTTLHTTYCEGLFDRVSKFEMLAHLVRELCWSDKIQDCIESHKPKWQRMGHEEQNFIDWAKKNGLGDQYSDSDAVWDTNIVLRCYLMAEVYQLLHWGVFVSYEWQEKRMAKDTSRAISDKITSFFKHHKKFLSLKTQLSTIVDKAIDLRNMLKNDDTAAYKMIVPNLRYADSRMSVLGENVRVMGLVGAPHKDDSRDVVRLVMFAGLQSEDLDPLAEDRRRVLETKPWVLVYRPGKHEELDEETKILKMLRKGSAENALKGKMIEE